MSIARIAPAKFEFQDLVCVELALRLDRAPTFSLFIEPLDGEDARITLADQDRAMTIEIQVKDEAPTVTLRRIAECLAHFPPRRARQCLFERLVGDPSRLVLLVMSGRCDDAASRYVVKPDWDGKPHSNGHLRRVDAVQLLGELSRVRPARAGRGRLAMSRKKHCQTLGREILPETVQQAAHRLLVLERTSAVDIEYNCCAYLHRNHRIPADRAVYVIGRLHNAVRIAKKDGTDAMPLIRAVLEENAPFSLRPTDYVERGEENAWTATLSKVGVLLLSGRPRCGKSEAARYVASQFERIGYGAREGSDVDDASRFLLDSGGGERLYVLHDPLGGIHPASDADRLLECLRGLVERIGPARKLIVAQNQDQLFATSRKTDLCHCTIQGRKWLDLGSPTPEFLGRVWERMADVARVGEPGRSMLRDALAGGSLSLDVGALRHVALSSDQLPRDPSLEQLLEKAREDAGMLGRALANQSREMEELLLALAIGSGPDMPISFAELGFLTNRKSADLPGREEYRSVGGDKEPSFPEYVHGPGVHSKVEICVESLERRGFVWIREDRAAFAHPFYRSAAEAVLRDPTARIGDLALRYLERGLFCLAPATSRSAARSLELLFIAFTANSTLTQRLIDTAVDGLNHSIFPATRDGCLNFLLDRWGKVPADQQQELASWVRGSTCISLNAIEWHDGEAWLPAQMPFGRYLPRNLSPTEEAEAGSDLADLSREGSPLVPPQRAVQVLRLLFGRPEAMSPQIAIRLLSYNESMIRAAAARIWLSRPRSRDAEIQRRIFEDLHPSVSLGALEGILDSWTANSTKRNTALLGGLASAATRPAVAIALLDTLGKFDRVEVTGSVPPWRVFGCLVPAVLRALPPSVHVYDDHLYSATRSAIKKLSPRAIAAICSEWIGWLEREIEYRLPTDYELGVAEIVIEGLQREPGQRAKLVRRLLELPSTGALLSIVRDFVQLWRGLNIDERNAVLEVLNTNRTDRRWLEAVAITRNEVPSEIQGLLLGHEYRLAEPPGTLVDEMREDLLAAAVAVYCGRPQPLWYLGTHHPRGSAFDAILRVIERRPCHPLFEIAFDEAVRSQDDDRVAGIIAHAGADHAEKLFQLLLRQKVIWSGNWLPKAWATLLDLRPGSSVRAGWIQRMAEAAPAILDDVFELARWLVTGSHYNEMLEQLKGDYTAILLVNTLCKIPPRERTSEFVTAAVALIRGSLHANPPQLRGTYSYVRDVLATLKIGIQPTESEITDGRHAALQRARHIEELFEKTDTPPMDWIGP